MGGRGDAVSKAGREAVGWVIRNRQEAGGGKWGTTYKSVVIATGQFASKIADKDSLLIRIKVEGWKAWEECLYHYRWARVYPEVRVEGVDTHNFRFFKSQ